MKMGGVKPSQEEQKGRRFGNRRAFTPQEDAYIRRLVSEGAEWKQISLKIPSRTPRQIRERYRNYLAPGLFNGPWTRVEDAKLMKLFKELGPKWSRIASCFDSRSDIAVKNRFAALSKITEVMAYVKGEGAPPKGYCKYIAEIERPPLPMQVRQQVEDPVEQDMFGLINPEDEFWILK